MYIFFLVAIGSCDFQGLTNPKYVEQDSRLESQTEANIVLLGLKSVGQVWDAGSGRLHILQY